MTTTIRTATTDDIDELLRLGRLMHAASTYASLPFSNDKTREFFKLAIQVDQALVLVAELDGKPVGMFVGAVGPTYFTQAQVASDFLLYLQPHARGGNAARQLVDAFEAWAVGKGAAQIRPSASTGGNLEAVVKLYQGAGYEVVGYSFLKQVNHVQN